MSEYAFSRLVRSMHDAKKSWFSYRDKTTTTRGRAFSVLAILILTWFSGGAVLRPLTSSNL